MSLFCLLTFVASDVISELFQPLTSLLYVGNRTIALIWLCLLSNNSNNFDCFDYADDDDDDNGDDTLTGTK